MRVFVYQVICMFLLSFQVSAQVRLPRLVSNGMVLQRDTHIRIWGWAEPGEKVSVEFIGATTERQRTAANEKGEWQVWLSKQKAGGPFTMKINASNRLVIENILVGDVWVCSGQSNMEQGMGARLKYKYADEIATVNNPLIRHFLVPDRSNYNAPQADVESGSWKEATTANISEFTAVGYFFAKEIYANHKIPVGLINAAWGGSPAEGWLSEEALKKFPEYHQRMIKFRDDRWIAEIEVNDQRKSREWLSTLDKNDQGSAGNWEDPSLGDSDWKEMNVPGNWNATAKDFRRGVMWFRKEINVPANMTGKKGKIELGRISDTDSVFINGKFVGNTTYQYPARRYEFDNTILKEGKNVIAIRATSNYGNGLFAPAKPYEITTGNDTIDLEGPWKYKVGYATDKPFPPSTNTRFQPGGLYNAMIAPLVKYPIKGVIWYQGETNSNYPGNYQAIMDALIRDWRMNWNITFPFLYVQLPNFMEPKPTPQTDSKWAELRQQQLQTLATPLTGMVTAIDLGEWNDLHPENKVDVSHRLFLWAEKLAYGNKTIVPSGPIIRSATATGNKIVLQFDYIGGGLVSKDGQPLRHFAIEGPDGKAHHAEATIKGNTVELWSESVSQPAIVWYAWADTPENVNFYNKEGLPASPFKIKVTRK